MTDLSKVQELKGLRSQLAKVEGDYLAAQNEAVAAQRKASLLATTAKSLKARIEALEKEPTVSGEPQVSEHAVLRYLERVKGVDLSAVRAEILTEDARRAIRFAGNCHVKRGDYTLVVQNSTVVTVK